MIFKNIVLMGLVVCAISCKDAPKESENVPAETTKEVVIEDSQELPKDAIKDSSEEKISIDPSSFFPFDKNLSSYNKELVRELSQGDCSNFKFNYLKENSVVSIDSVFCDIYGFRYDFYLVNNDNIEIFHQKTAESQEGFVEALGHETETANYVFTETIYDFRVTPYKQYFRTDTVVEMDIDLLTSEFSQFALEDEQAAYDLLLAQYTDNWGVPSENSKVITLSEDRLGSFSLQKDMTLDESMLSDAFAGLVVTRKVGSQDGPNFYYFDIGDAIYFMTPDTEQFTLTNLRIEEAKVVKDSYGAAVGLSYYELIEMRPNLKFSTEHSHVFLEEEGSNIKYEMSLEGYQGPDKESYTIEDIPNTKIIAIIWE